MKLQIKAGSTSQSVMVFIQNNSVTTGAGLTGLVYNTASLVAYYTFPGAATAATAITLATLATVGTAYASGGFKEIDATNMPGLYRLDLPNAALASGNGRSVVVMLQGAANMVPTLLEIELTAVDNQDAVRFGMTALPNANAEAAGGLYTRGTGAGQINQNANGSIDTNSKTWNGLTTVALPLVPTTAGRTLDVSAGGEAGIDWANIGSPTTANALTATTIAVTQKVDVDTIKTNPVVNAGTITFPTGGTLASTTNITAGTITTVTNLTNAPTNGDLTATMKASVTTAATAATPTAAGVTAAVTITGDLSATMKTSVTTAATAATPTAAAVTGNVGGNVVGSVGSVTGLNAALLDVAVSTRLASGSYTAPDNSGITAIKTKTDFLPSILAGAAGGLFIAGTNAATTITGSLTTTFTGNLTGNIGGTVPDSSGTTTLVSRLTAQRATNLDNLDAAISTVPGLVWDIVLASHQTAGSTGFALNAAGSAGDPWSTVLPGGYSAGTAGYIVGHNIDALISSRLDSDSYVAPDNTTITAINSKTTNLPVAPAAVGSAMTLTTGERTAIATATLLLDWTTIIATVPARCLLQAARFLRNKWSLSGNVLTVTKEDDTTTAWAANVSTDAGALPVVGNDPTT